MSTLRRRLVGSVALLAAAASLYLASETTLAVVPSSSSPTGLSVVTPSPVSLLASPLLLAAGSVLLVGGVAALADADLSARAALSAPAIGAATAVAFGLGLGVAPESTLATATDPAAYDLLRSGFGARIAAGAIAGAAIAPVVRATITEDTVTLLVGAALLLASVVAGSGSPLGLVTGGVSGAGAVGLLWAVDPETWRP
ncbi:hypothetical protein [Halorubrum sp. CSM-61]|uniref:hypothetical protein n=1 Tax=Halorubrum sp. CSM-61 TaxID=2485838 RepID=UPI000F4B6CD4|nr:hypothetical protein [Halorubrum sp. CSM-61]